VARTVGHLVALAPLRAPGFEVEVRLSRETAAWLIENVRQAREHAEDWVLHGTTFPTLEQAVAHGADERALIAALSQESSPRVQGLPPCLCPGARIERTPRILRRDLFHADGRLSVDAFTDRYVHDDYRVKSLRCRDCAVDDLCPGAHIQAVRARGFGILQPVAGAWAGVAAARLCDLAEEAPEVPRVRSGSAPVRLPDPLLPVLPSADLPAVPAVDFPSSVRRS